MLGPRDDDDVREPHELLRDGDTRDLEKAEEIFMDDAAKSDGYLDRDESNSEEED